jgi:hypothetical protein
VLWEHDAAGSEPKANGRAVVNDMPVAYQSREVTEPQRDGGRRMPDGRRARNIQVRYHHGLRILCFCIDNILHYINILHQTTQKAN